MENIYIDKLLAYLKKYEGRKVSQLLDELNITTTAKSKNYMLAINLVYGFQGKSITAANLKLNEIMVKTITLTKSGRPKEAMSFSPIKYVEIVNEEWDNSAFKRILDKTFLFFVFQITGEKDFILKKIIKYKIPKEDIDGEFQLVWKDTKRKIANGTIIQSFESRRIVNWFMNEETTQMCHVRPHGQSSADIIDLPVPDKLMGYRKYTKVSFWFNHKYLQKIVDEN